MEDTLLEVRDLQVEFSTKMGIVRVLDKVNLKSIPGRPWASSANPGAARA